MTNFVSDKSLREKKKKTQTNKNRKMYINYTTWKHFGFCYTGILFLNVNYFNAFLKCVTC